MQIIRGIENEDFLKVVSKKNNELITKITEELLHDYEISCLPNSIISYWYPIDLKLEEHGEPVTIFESPNYQKHPDSSLFDFTANVIRRTLVKNDLDLLVDDLANMEWSEMSLENGDTILNYTYRIGEIGFKINHSFIEKYTNEMNKLNKIYGDNIEIFKPGTLEYEQKCGFNDRKKEVRLGPFNFSVYNYIGFITEYLVKSPQIKRWNMMLKYEEFIKIICELESELKVMNAFAK